MKLGHFRSSSTVNLFLDSGLLTFRAVLFALLHFNEFFPDPARGVDKFMKPFELHRILRLLIIRLFVRLLGETGGGKRER